VREVGEGSEEEGALRNKRNVLRPDTTVEPVGKGSEVYVREMPQCCLRSLKQVAGRETEEKRLLSLECEVCGRDWRVTSSLDERILGRFVMHGGPRIGGSHPAA
ncbi:MAG: hypothetical protein ACRDSJ_10305, partial [Rubrobacteraceae bacterium]